jgi:hypothetical protein
MEAELVYHDKWMAADNLVEIEIWSVPASHKRPYGYKYSLVYIKSGNRIIGYDNAEDKGDHRHYRNEEEPYAFKSIDKLFEDFYKDVRRF